MEHYLDLFIKFAVFIENLALSFFLGMCTFLAVSKNVKTALGLGAAVIVVQGLTVPINNLIFTGLAQAGRRSRHVAGLRELRPDSFLGLIIYIGVIAAMVQILEMFLDRYVPALYNALGIFLPLLTVNCAILGGTLFMVQRNYDFGESVAYGFGSGAGLGARDRGPGRNPRAPLLQPIRRPALRGLGHHVHHDRPDGPRLHGVRAGSAVGSRDSVVSRSPSAVSVFTFSGARPGRVHRASRRSYLIPSGDVTIRINNQQGDRGLARRQAARRPRRQRDLRLLGLRRRRHLRAVHRSRSTAAAARSFPPSARTSAGRGARGLPAVLPGRRSSTTWTSRCRPRSSKRRSGTARSARTATSPLSSRNSCSSFPKARDVGFKAGGYIQIEVPPHEIGFKEFEIEEQYRDETYLAGDGAHRDEDRYFWIMGRIDDVMNISGHRIGTMEVESALVVPREGRREPPWWGAQTRSRAPQSWPSSSPTKADTHADDALKQNPYRRHVTKEIGAIARAGGNPLHQRAAQDPLRQDHAPPAAGHRIRHGARRRHHHPRGLQRPGPPPRVSGRLKAPCLRILEKVERPVNYFTGLLRPYEPGSLHGENDHEENDGHDNRDTDPRDTGAGRGREPDRDEHRSEGQAGGNGARSPRSESAAARSAW